MKTLLVYCGIALCAMSFSMTAEAKVSQEYKAEADQYYQQGEFRKAYKMYYKLAKSGDNHAQHRVAQMFARGEGTDADLVQAYAWSVLAKEGGEDEAEKYSEALLSRVEDKEEAQEEAFKLKKKYGKHALQMKERNRNKQRSSGNCTGTHLRC